MDPVQWGDDNDDDDDDNNDSIFSRVIDHLTSWRGGDWGHPLSKLLCQIWREEELKIGASRDEFGAILDVAAPLAGVMQRHLRTANGDQVKCPGSLFKDEKSTYL